MRKILTVVALALLFATPALAQEVNTEGDVANSSSNDVNIGGGDSLTPGTVVIVPFDNGIVDRKTLHVEALGPTAVDGDGDGIVDDAQAHMLVKAKDVSATRYAWVSLARKTGTNTYVIINTKEYNWNNNGTGGLVAKDGTVVDCNVPGSDIYVTIITGKKQGDNPRSDRSQEATLPVVNC